MNRNKAMEMLERLRVRTKDRGATPNEAAMAASLAEKIAKRYGLDLNPKQGQSRFTIKEKRFPRWANVVCHAMEKRFKIDGFFQHLNGRPAEITFTGPVHLTSVAAWLVRAIKIDLDKRSYVEAKAMGLKGGQLMRFRNKFRLSAAWEISDRLNPDPEFKRLNPTPEQVAKAEAEVKRDSQKYDDMLAKMTPAERQAEFERVMRDSRAIRNGRAFGKEVDIGTNAVGDQSGERLRLEHVQ